MNADNQNLAILADEEKFPFLVNSIKKHGKQDKPIMVFCGSHRQVELVYKWLELCDLGSVEMKPSSEVTTDILVCNDSVIDKIPENTFSKVFHYDLPFHAKNYTGRLKKIEEGAKSIALCGIKDCEGLEYLEDFLKYKIPRLQLSDDDFAKDLPQAPVLPPREPRDRDRNSRDKKPRDRKPRSTQDKTEKIVKSNDKILTQPKKREPKMNLETNKPNHKMPANFTVSTNSHEAALNKAMKFFKVKDTSLLNKKVVAKGPKKFFFFGPQEVTYEFSYKSNSKIGEKIEPFFKKLIKMMNLEITFRVEEKPGFYNIHLEGDDLGLVLNNRKQLMFALDSVLKQFVIKKVDNPGRIKVGVYAQGTHKRENTNRAPRKNSNHSGDRKNFRNSRKTKVDEAHLNDLAKKLKDEVIKTGETQYTDTMHPADRRIIHQFFESEANLTTSSIGDGRFKKVQISIFNQ